MRGCEHCNEWPVIISQKCHPRAATYALLHENGVIQIKCVKCDKEIVAFNTDVEEEDERIPGRNIH